MHPDHPKAERDWRWNLFREGEHQHAVRKKRAVHYHPGIGGTGRMDRDNYMEKSGRTLENDPWKFTGRNGYTDKGG